MNTQQLLTVLLAVIVVTIATAVAFETYHTPPEEVRISLMREYGTTNDRCIYRVQTPVDEGYLSTTCVFTPGDEYKIIVEKPEF